MTTGYARKPAGTTGVSQSVAAEEARATAAENARRNRFVDQGVAKTALYASAVWHSVHYDCTSGSIAQPLPSSPTAGDEVELYLDATSGSNVLTATFGGTTVATIQVAGHGITLRYNGTAWKEGPDRKSLASLRADGDARWDALGAASSAQANAIAASQGAWNVRAVSAPATAAAWDSILADTSPSGTFAIAAPTPTANKQFAVKWTAGTVAPTLTGTFESTPTFYAVGQAMEFIADGTKWYRLVRPALQSLPDYPAVTDGRYPQSGASTGGTYYAKFFTGATTDLKVAAAMAQAIADGGGTVVIPGGAVITDWAKTVRIPSGLARELKIRGANKGGVTIRTSATCPRAFDFDRTANDQVFQNVILEDFTVDANNVDGLACGPATTVATGVTLNSGRTTVALASVSGWVVRTDTNSGLLCFTSGAAAGRSMFFDTINTGANTVSIRNDGATVALVAGDGVTGSCVDHVVIGTQVQGGSIVQNRMNFDNVQIRSVKTINVPTSQSVYQTARVNFPLTVPNGASDPYTYCTNIKVKDCEFNGGCSGVVLGGQGQVPRNGLVDHVYIADVYHTTGFPTPTANYASSHVQVGGTFRVGANIKVSRIRGEYSGDTGIEIDSAEGCEVLDCVIDDAFGGAFFTTNFNVPGSDLPTSSTISNTGAGITNSTSTINMASSTGFKNRGWVYVDNELIYYTGISGNNLYWRHSWRLR